MTGLLKKFYDSYKIDANQLGFDWKKLTKTELANGYCDADKAGDVRNKERYFSALMCKYSYMVTVFYKRRASVLQRLEIEDFHIWVAESLLKGLKYRRWRDPEFKELYENPNGAEVVFNRCFYSTEKRYYKYYNQDCRKTVYVVESLDDIMVSNSLEYDGDIDFIETIEDPSSDPSETPTDFCRDLVQAYVNSGKIIQALIIDGIGYQDTFKETKNDVECVDDDDNEFTRTSTTYNFNARKLVKHLNHLDNNFIRYFQMTYGVDKKTLQDWVNKIGKMKNNKLYTILDNTLEELRNSQEIKEALGRV